MNMAPFFVNLFFYVLYVFLLFIPFANLNPSSSENLVEYSLSAIGTAVREGCVLVALNHASTGLLTALKRLSRAFVNESRVNVGVLKQSEVITWDVKSANFLEEEDLAFFPQQKMDRSCLLRPKWDSQHVKAEQCHGIRTVENLLSFLNAKCDTFRELDGSLSSAGQTRERILRNLYHVPNTFNAGSTGPVNVGTACDRIPPPSGEQFFYDYFWRSKPVIISGALKTWPAMERWTSEFLRTKFGERIVRVAFAPNGEYEGCDKAKHFDNFQDFDIPETVKSQLHFPDLVVVRPAFLDIPFSAFMEIIQSSNNSNVSAYLEYSSIPSLLPELERDIRELPFIAGKLKRRHLNIWLSNGNTLGKLHFDPFDNFLCQISGKKQLFLYEPHNNTKLYEAHIQEATLGYDASRLKFRRQKLLDSTSMVMSPVDILQPDYDRFPKFKGQQP